MVASARGEKSLNLIIVAHPRLQDTVALSAGHRREMLKQRRLVHGLFASRPGAAFGIRVPQFAANASPPVIRLEEQVTARERFRFNVGPEDATVLLENGEDRHTRQTVIAAETVKQDFAIKGQRVRAGVEVLVESHDLVVLDVIRREVNSALDKWSELVALFRRDAVDCR